MNKLSKIFVIGSALTLSSALHAEVLAEKDVITSNGVVQEIKDAIIVSNEQDSKTNIAHGEIIYNKDTSIVDIKDIVITAIETYHVPTTFTDDIKAPDTNSAGVNEFPLVATVDEVSYTHVDLDNPDHTIPKDFFLKVDNFMFDTAQIPSDGMELSVEDKAMKALFTGHDGIIAGGLESEFHVSGEDNTIHASFDTHIKELGDYTLTFTIKNTYDLLDGRELSDADLLGALMASSLEDVKVSVKTSGLKAALERLFDETEGRTTADFMARVGDDITTLESKAAELEKANAVDSFGYEYTMSSLNGLKAFSQAVSEDKELVVEAKAGTNIGMSTMMLLSNAQRPRDVYQVLDMEVTYSVE